MKKEEKEGRGGEEVRNACVCVCVSLELALCFGSSSCIVSSRLVSCLGFGDGRGEGGKEGRRETSDACPTASAVLLLGHISSPSAAASSSSLAGGCTYAKTRSNRLQTPAGAIAAAHSLRQLPPPPPPPASSAQPSTDSHRPPAATSTNVVSKNSWPLDEPRLGCAGTNNTNSAVYSLL